MEEINTLSNSDVLDLDIQKEINTLLPYPIEQNLDLVSKKEKQDLIKTTDVFTKKEKQEVLNKTTNFSTGENSIIAELFKMKGFIGNEHWEKTLNISSRIASFNNDYVLCECLIDKENKIFEQRSFPRYLFNHIENIKSKPYVLLSIQSKTGSTRIDVIKGDNLVDKKAFELKDEWAEFEGPDFNQPLDKPIQL